MLNKIIFFILILSGVAQAQFTPHRVMISRTRGLKVLPAGDSGTVLMQGDSASDPSWQTVSSSGASLPDTAGQTGFLLKDNTGLLWSSDGVGSKMFLSGSYWTNKDVGGGSGAWWFPNTSNPVAIAGSIAFYTNTDPTDTLNENGRYAYLVPSAGTLRNLTIFSETAPTGTSADTLTLWKNGASTSLRVIITGSQFLNTDSTHTLSVKKGDLISIKFDFDNAAENYDLSSSLEYDYNGVLLNENFSGTSSGTNTGDASLAGEPYLSISGQQITAHKILDTNITGGTDGQVLTSHGAGVPVSWEDVGGGGSPYFKDDGGNPFILPYVASSTYSVSIGNGDSVTGGTANFVAGGLNNVIASGGGNFIAGGASNLVWIGNHNFCTGAFNINRGSFAAVFGYGNENRGDNCFVAGSRILLGANYSMAFNNGVVGFGGDSAYFNTNGIFAINNMDVWISNTDTVARALRLFAPNGSKHVRDPITGGTLKYVGFQSPTSPDSSFVYKLPSHDGAAGQVLGTNGGAALSWNGYANLAWGSINADSTISVSSDNFTITHPATGQYVITLTSAPTNYSCVATITGGTFGAITTTKSGSTITIKTDTILLVATDYPFDFIVTGRP